MHGMSLDPILLLGVIFVALLFWLCVFLDNVFRKTHSRKRGKRQSFRGQNKQQQKHAQQTARHIHIHLNIK